MAARDKIVTYKYERAKPYGDTKLAWPEHGLDWTKTFPMLVKDGSGGYEVFEMPTAHMMARSEPISRALGYYKPDAQDRVQGIEAPDRGVATFKYYERVVRTNEATLDENASGPELSTTASNKDSVADANRDNDASEANIVTTSYCQGHFLAEELGDGSTAYLIRSVLIEHFVKTNTHFSSDHLRMMTDFQARSDRRLISSLLWGLALDLWIFAPRRRLEAPCASPSASPSTSSPTQLSGRFTQDLFRQEMTHLHHGWEVKEVEKIEDCPFLRGPPWRYVPLSKSATARDDMRAS